MMKKFYNINEGFDFDAEDDFGFNKEIEIHNNERTFKKVEELLDMAMFLHKEHLLLDGNDLIDETFNIIFRIHIPIIHKGSTWSITLYNKYTPACKLIKKSLGKYVVAKLNGLPENIVATYESTDSLPIEISKRIDSVYNTVKSLIDQVNPAKLRKDFFDFARALVRKENREVISNALYPEYVSYVSDTDVYFNDKGIRKFGLETIASSHKSATIYGEAGHYYNNSVSFSFSSEKSPAEKEEFISKTVKFVSPYSFYKFRDLMVEAVPEIFTEKINEAFDFDEDDNDDKIISDVVSTQAEIARFSEILNETSNLIRQWMINHLLESFNPNSDTEVRIYPNYYTISVDKINMNGEQINMSLSSKDFSPIVLRVNYGDHIKFQNLPLESKLDLINHIKVLNKSMKDIMNNPQEIDRMWSKINEVKDFIESKKKEFWYSDCPYISHISEDYSKIRLIMYSNRCGIYLVSDDYKVIFMSSLCTDYDNAPRINPFYYKTIDFDSVAKTIMESKSTIKPSEIPAFYKDCEDVLKDDQDCKNLIDMFTSLKLVNFVEFPGFTLYRDKSESRIRFNDMAYTISDKRDKEKKGLYIYNVRDIFGISKSVSEAKNKVITALEKAIPKAIKYPIFTLEKFDKILETFSSPSKIKMKRGVFYGSSKGFVYCLKNHDTLAYWDGSLYFGGGIKQMENIVEEVLEYFSEAFKEVTKRDLMIKESLVDTLREAFGINEANLKIRLGAISGKFCEIDEGKIKWGIKAMSGRLDFYRDSGSPLGSKIISLNIPSTEKTKDKEKALDLLIETIPDNIDGKIPVNYKEIFYRLINYHD